MVLKQVMVALVLLRTVATGADEITPKGPGAVKSKPSSQYLGGSRDPRESQMGSTPTNSSIYFNVPDLVRAAGYPLEEHEVKTADGYILTMHRIPHGREASGKSDNPKPVLLHHGHMLSSADFLVNDPPLAYSLADAGYDVWLANTRGNYYSCGHVKNISCGDAEFDRFSFDEKAQFDLPADIEYVLETTKSSSLKYVGYSMGSTVFFALPKFRPDVAKKVEVMVALAPAAYMSNIRGFFRMFAPYSANMMEMLRLMGITSTLQNTGKFNQMVLDYCRKPYTISTRMCVAMMEMIGGRDGGQFNQLLLPQAFLTSPAGFSMRTRLHYDQIALSGKFCMFDHGSAKLNRKHYGQDTPPLYDLGLVSTPVALFSGSEDFISTPEDVRKLASELPNVIQNTVLSDPAFNHFHFVWGKDAPTLVNEKILELFKKYDGEQ